MQGSGAARLLCATKECFSGRKWRAGIAKERQSLMLMPPWGRRKEAVLPAPAPPLLASSHTTCAPLKGGCAAEEGPLRELGLAENGGVLSCRMSL